MHGECKLFRSLFKTFLFCTFCLKICFSLPAQAASASPRDSTLPSSDHSNSVVGEGSGRTQEKAAEGEGATGGVAGAGGVGGKGLGKVEMVVVGGAIVVSAAAVTASCFCCQDLCCWRYCRCSYAEPCSNCC